MKKLELDLGTLAVESFATARSDARAGTVRGNQALNFCPTQISYCEKCFYTADPCECTSQVTTG